MSKDKAVDLYLGKDGHACVNCAQAIALAFKDKAGIEGDLMVRLAMAGGGQAPEGMCGTLYAAKILFGERDPKKFAECVAKLAELAGSIKCREIRSLRRLSCAECVETVGGCLEDAE